MSPPDLKSGLWRGLLITLGLFALKRVLDKVLAIRKAFNAVSYLPCRQLLLFHPFGPFSLAFPDHYPGRGRIGNYWLFFSLYKKYGSTVLSSVALSTNTPVFWIADADALKTVTTEKFLFQKELEFYEAVNCYGTNLISTEGATWKRHRLIANPAFNEANIALVWSETNRLFGQWMAQVQSRQEPNGELPILDLNPEMIKFTLLVLTSTAFGHGEMQDQMPSSTDSTYKFTFEETLQIVIDNILFRYLTPSFVSKLCRFVPIPKLAKRVRECERGFEELGLHMLDLISAARNAIAAGQMTTTANAVLLRNLVEANMKQEGDHKSLTDQELLADCFGFLLAGHETSSHALSFAIMIIAFYPDIQRKIYEEVNRVWPNGPPALGQISTYKDDFKELVGSQSYFTILSFSNRDLLCGCVDVYPGRVPRTMRHHNPVPRLTKTTMDNTVLVGHRFEPGTTPPLVNQGVASGQLERFEVPIPKGSLILLDFQAVHMNPMHWGEDASYFRPERFVDTETYRWPRDAFLSFSAGARACIGQRFALTESVAILANIVRAFEILLPPQVELKVKEMEKSGVGELERFAWMTAWTPGVTNTPLRAHVRVKRRA